MRVGLFLLGWAYFYQSLPTFTRVSLFLSEWAYFYKDGPIFIRVGLFYQGGPTK